MNNAKHTPGPWMVDVIRADLPGYVLISTASQDHDPNSHHIGLAQVVWSMEDDRTEGNNSPQCEANARLIAAAPELLLALKDLVTTFDALHPEVRGIPGTTIALAHAAIAKAELV